MNFLFLALLVQPTTALATFRDLEDFSVLKGESVVVEISHNGKQLPQVVHEKQEGARICQKIATSADVTHFEFQCFNVQAMGADALSIYNSAIGDELSVVFKNEKGHALAGTQSMQKLTKEGFCRRANSLSSYFCYARSN